MSDRQTIAQRHNTVLAGLACALSLAAAAGPAMADPVALERVNVRGRVIEAPVRYDVHATCAGIDDQIEQSLGAFAARERVRGEFQVQFVMENGRIDAVQTQGPYRAVAREVRYATYHLECSQPATSGPLIYRFNVAFVEPTRAGQSTLAVRELPLRIASLDR